MHGYDRTSYNGAKANRKPGTDVWEIPGTYAGWTASDLTASVEDVARFGYDLYGISGPHLLSHHLQQKMIPHGPIYGFGAFNLSFFGISGQSMGGPYFKAYGHAGATYGYDSLLAYYPGIDVAFAIGTNIETDFQLQPSEAMCYAYNAVLAATLKTRENCTFVQHKAWGGICNCGNNYECSADQGKCIPTLRGGLSKIDCEKTC